jgi:hypothetical protein
MPPTTRKGPLESLNIHLEKDQGENLKKVVSATKAIFDAIGSSAAASTDAKK